jgi:hypothetical protein
MSRRFQFSLRALLGLAAIASLSLGGWHLLETYGTYVDAENPRVGEPIRISGRFVWLFGPNECHLDIGHTWADESGCTFSYCVGKRSWLCFYSVEQDFDPVDRPGQIEVFLNRREGLRRGLLRKRSWT